MPEEFRIVTIEDGAGPVKAIRDPLGRIVTAEQMNQNRQRLDQDLARVADLHDKLVAGDADATTQIVNQVKQRLVHQHAALQQQTASAATTLAKLEANDPDAVAEVTTRMGAQLRRRVEQLTAARDRSVQVLNDIAPDKVNV